MEREEELEQTIDELNYDLTNAFEKIKRLESSIKKAREQMLDSKFHGKTVLTYNDAINDCIKIIDKLTESEV